MQAWVVLFYTKIDKTADILKNISKSAKNTLNKPLSASTHADLSSMPESFEGFRTKK